jgi:hypothetical protein
VRESEARRLRLRVWVAQAMDLATFAAFFALVGGASSHVERNPIVAASYALAGLAGVGLLKMGLVTVAMRQRPPAARLPGWRGALSRPITHAWYWPLYTVILSAAAASGIAGAGFNAASLIDSLWRP